MSDQRQERSQQPEELFQRQRGPIEKALTPQEGQDFTWKRSYGEIQTYEHDRTHGRVHIDPQGQFYDRHAQPITREAALDHARETAETLGDETLIELVARETRVR